MPLEIINLTGDLIGSELILREYAFSMDETKQPEVLATSGCFSFIHAGHQSFIEDFMFLHRLLRLPAIVFVNSKSYIQDHKKISQNLMASLDEERNAFFDNYKVRVVVSDDGLEEYDLSNVLWFTGSEYTHKSFKESRYMNKRVVGNVFRVPTHEGSSRDLIAMRELWNIRNVLKMD